MNIPTEDSDAWLWYPEHRWVYDKIAVARSQGLEAAPHGVPPPRFPVFSKPITNLKGMGIGSRVLALAGRVRAEPHARPHVDDAARRAAMSARDVAVVEGEPRWWRHVTGAPGGEGTFDYWTVHAAREPGIEDYCGAWIRRHLDGYTGILNIETIGGRMIEVHLRMSDQWPDLNGAGWVDAVVAPLSRAPMGVRRPGPARRLQRRACSGRTVRAIAIRRRRWSRRCGSCPDVSSVQITFHEDKEPAQHAMPPGGFRLAVVNAWSLQAGLAGRELLRAHFLARAM